MSRIRSGLILVLALLALRLFAAEPPLSDRLLSSVGEVREDAVKEFDQLPHEMQERFIPTFMVGLSSDDPEVHDQAAALLKKLGATPRTPSEEVAADPVETPVQRKTRDQQSLEDIQRLKTDRYKNLKTELEQEKRAAAHTPSEMDTPSEKKTDPIRDALVDGLTDPVPFVRSRSARRLAGLQPPVLEAIPTLIDMLRDSDAECRGSAAGALGSIGPAAREAEVPLEKLTGDSNPEVRGIAKAALMQVRGGQF